MIGRLLPTVILFTIALPYQAYAVDGLSQIDRLAIANAHDETIKCGVYYSIVTRALQNEPNPDREIIETIEKLQQVSHALSERVLLLGRMIGMKQETSFATMRVAVQNMMQEIDNGFINFPILFEKYSDLCIAVTENPDSRITHWMNEAAREQ